MCETRPRGQLTAEEAHNCLFICTYALLAQTLLCIAIPVVLGGSAVTGDRGEGDMHYSGAGEGIATILNIARWIIMICVCVSFGIISFELPKGMWPNGTPPVSPAVQCVMVLLCQFFCAFGGISQTVRSSKLHPTKPTSMKCRLQLCRQL